MFRGLGVLVVMMFFSGCAITLTQAPENYSTEIVEVKELPFGLALGMSRKEVLNVLEREVVIGYDIDWQTSEPHPVKTSNLYSSEVVMIRNIAYQVDQFLTQEIQLSDVVPQNLFPVVFQNDILIAQGFEELEALKEESSATSDISHEE